ncbi:E3 ubiquitin-protein ligase RMA1H1-like [Salvia hispanica]|uniref:E3 ubiquitin-protein ligase RMA1H1-like n=1 Tax=Salvia hispanica TaxID=49212 RepID=UPI002009AB1C|nr:E3 ubiquitin-protein ligase RMA1H1-like [Salvia hispanica]
MAFQQYFMQGWESIPQASTESEKPPSACFDCSICLDFAQDPVVTLCGHLYCWPCIYKWFDSQSSSLGPDERPQCPVCKAEISEKTMVPLYGRGKSLSEAGAEGKVIPPRPPACGIRGLADLFSPEHQLPSPSRDSYQNRHDFPNAHASYGVDSSPQLFNLGGTAGVPTIGMFGEMVYARVFGNSQSLYTYPNSYHTVVSRSPRLRRQELQADKSLNRVTIFLFCFFLLCLLVF